MSKTTVIWTRVAASVLMTVLILCGAGLRTMAVPTLDELMGDFAFSADDVQCVRKGELVKTTTKETSERELAVVMVFLVKAPAPTLVSAFEIGKGFRNDPQVQAAIEIRGEGTLDDFTAAVLQPGGDKETPRYLAAAPQRPPRESTNTHRPFSEIFEKSRAGFEGK